MRFLPIDPFTIQALIEGRHHGEEQMYAYTRQGDDFHLHIPYTGTILFDSPEEAEQIAGAILAGLARDGLPRRPLP